jgi:hypothetical protein
MSSDIISINYFRGGECGTCVNRTSGCPDGMIQLLLRNTIDSSLDGPIPASATFPLNNDGQIVRAVLALTSVREQCVVLDEPERPITQFSPADTAILAMKPDYIRAIID